jgi:hypothetical protein
VPAELIITAINRADRSLADRIQVKFTRSWLSLQDGVQIERSNQRLLSRQAQLCLVADQRAESRMALAAMQRGFSGYFLAVGIDSAPLDYGSALQNPPCPDAHYIFYVDVVAVHCQGERAPDGQCADSVPAELIITAINRADRSLADRIQVKFTRSWLSLQDEQSRLSRSFEQLAAVLTGAGDSP